MNSILTLTIPFLGRIMILWDTTTQSRWAIEPLEGPAPHQTEALVCLGSLRVYLTPHRSGTSSTTPAQQWLGLPLPAAPATLPATPAPKAHGGLRERRLYMVSASDMRNKIGRGCHDALP